MNGIFVRISTKRFKRVLVVINRPAPLRFPFKSKRDGDSVPTRARAFRFMNRNLARRAPFTFLFTDHFTGHFKLRFMVYLSNKANFHKK